VKLEKMIRNREKKFFNTDSDKIRSILLEIGRKDFLPFYETGKNH